MIFSARCRKNSCFPKFVKIKSFFSIRKKNDWNIISLIWLVKRDNKPIFLIKILSGIENSYCSPIKCQKFDSVIIGEFLKI